MAMPLFAFRSAPMRLRVLLALVIAFALMPMVQDNLPPIEKMPPGYALVFVELAVGLTSGWMVRVGLSAVDMLADVLSQQSGLSFAATLQQDANLASGLVGEFLGLLALALAFTMNIHLVMLELLVNSGYLALGLELVSNFEFGSRRICVGAGFGLTCHCHLLPVQHDTSHFGARKPSNEFVLSRLCHHDSRCICGGGLAPALLLGVGSNCF